MRKTGTMGLGLKSNLGRGALWAFRIALCLSTVKAAADDGVQYATVLPSHVKHVSVKHGKAKVAKKAKHKAKASGKGSAGPTMLAADFAPELRAEAQANPDASKYFSRTVHYARSSEPLPEEYDCDPEKAEQKLHEAEAQAQAKCENAAAAGESCHLAKSVIARTGVLECRDFPGAHCPGAGHYRGCVAEALVLGEREGAAASGETTAAAAW